METAAKSPSSAAHTARLAVSWLLFIVFVGLLGFGIVIYAQTTTRISGLAMAIIGILGIAVLATSLRLARGRPRDIRRGIYTGGGPGVPGYSYGVAGTRNVGGIHQHDHWFQHQMLEEQRRRDVDYHQQQMQQQTFYVQQQQQQQQQQQM
jgi:hypothetical protein